MQFNPEDGLDFGPHCRNCHKGSSACNTCHETTSQSGYTDIAPLSADATYDFNGGKAGIQGKSTVNPKWTSTMFVADLVDEGSDGWTNDVSTATANNTHYAFYKNSRTVDWTTDLRTTTTDFGSPGKDSVVASGGTCSDDGFSWPHRTLGWMMLKDDLFGLDFDGSIIAAGDARNDASVAHDIDSVCLDCHNPNIWNATSTSHTDGAGTADDYNDELLLRGLP